MTLRGHIEKGAIVLDTPASLPEGMRVEVRFLESPRRLERVPKPGLVAFMDSFLASNRTPEEWEEYNREFQAERDAWD